MAARAIWKGIITFEDVRVPVKLYSAVEDRTVHFRLLHEADHVPVEQHMVHPGTGDVVPRGEVRKGYEAEPGVFVLLDDEDLEAAEPEGSREIEITRFLEPARISHAWYDRPYYLGPDENDGAYAALVDALGGTGTEGVARWTMRKKEYVGALRLEGEHLMLITLRRAGEVIEASDLDAPEGRDLEPQEIEMAEKLIATLEGDFDPAEYADEYRERVLELVEAKARGELIEFEKYEPREEAESLVAALEESVESAKKERASAA